MNQGPTAVRHSRIEALPLALLCAGAMLGSLPLLSHVAPWAICIFFGSVFIRLLVNYSRLRLPSFGLKLLIIVGAITGTAFSYGSVLGIEPGLSIFLILVALKILETNSTADFQVTALLGWFLSLCVLFFSQDLRTGLFVGAIALILTVALIRFHAGAGRFWPATRLALTLFIQASPLVLLMFVFFPRTYGSFQFNFTRAISSTTGMSDQLEPGAISSLALNSTPAFRVEFPDKNAPAPRDLYWRGGVLWQGNGLNWARGNLFKTFLGGSAALPNDIRQRIVIEPHGGRWIFALDQPVAVAPRMALEAGRFLQSPMPLRSSFRYEVRSRPGFREQMLFPQERYQALQKPVRVSPRLQALVQSWRDANPEPQALVDSALKYFRTEKFLYSLTPGPYGNDGLDVFLFQRRIGFCEHYAAAFATLMRLSGVPSRVVFGYHGGELNTLGSYMIVRQSDAHAWCEVWMDSRGWVRVDPANALAADGAQAGTSLASILRQQASAETGSTGPIQVQSLLRNVSLAWDSLNYQWNLRVLTFDEENQHSLLENLGLGDRDWSTLLPWCMAGITVLLTLIAVFQTRRSRVRLDAVSAGYARFCQILHRAGLSRLPGQGPADFIELAATRFPAQAAQIRRIGDLYIALRYARNPPSTDPAAFLRAVAAIKGKL